MANLVCQSNLTAPANTLHNAIGILICRASVIAVGNVSFYQGLLTAEIVGSAELSGEGISEVSVYTLLLNDIPLFSENITVACCSFPIPLTLELKHGLNLILPLARFLNQNNVFLPGLITTPQTDYIKLNFSTRESAWIGNVHLIGDSPVVSGQETWDMNFSFGCQMSGTWNFMLSIFVRRSMQKIVSTFTASFPAGEVCSNKSFMNLVFALSNGVTIPPSAVVINDESNFFSNLRMSFKVLSQDVQPLSQLDEDNTAAFIATLGDS